MKKTIWIGAVVVVLSLLAVQLTKRMAHGAWSVAKEVDRTEQADSLATKNTKPHEKEVSTAKHAENAKDSESVKSVSSVDKKYSEDDLSDPVKALLGLDGKVRNYSELIKEIGVLKTDLSAADVAALRDLLNFPNDQFPEKMRPIEINAVKNDVLDKLLRQTELSEGLGIQMAEMASDPSNDPVWRDYSIQFMGQFYDRFTTEYTEDTEGESSENSVSSSDSSAQALATEEVGGKKISTEASAIHDAMFQALEERSETLAGTSLIGLELLSRTNEEFDRELIVEKTVEIAADESASPSSRLTALRLAAGLTTENTENTEAIHVARSLAQTGETFLLRSAAIVTLGEIGTADDRELLESFTFSENKQIVAAAQLALQKMEDVQ